MRIGIRAHDVAYAPLEELIPNIHAQGFHCMHIALSKSIKEFKPGVETMTPGLAIMVRAALTSKAPNARECKKLMFDYDVLRFGRLGACKRMAANALGKREV